MRFIHIVPERPLATGSGAQIRAHSLSRAMNLQGEVLTVNVAEALTKMGLPPVRADSFIEADLPESVLADVLQCAHPGPNDTVVVEGVFLAAVARHLVSSGIRVVLDAHNVESNLLRQTDLARHPILARLQRRGRWRRAAEAERKLLEHVSAVWACSTMDAESLRQLAPGIAPIHVVPNPVPNWCADIVLEPRTDGIDALFVGHLGYRPNIVASRRLARSIFPALRKVDSSARLTLAGRAPAESLSRVLTGAKGNLTLIADPIDLAPLYAQATMTLMPLSEGGGTRIKALEAMAIGLPVIASAKAVEGLAVTPGREFLIAESDAEFVEAALLLAKTPGLRADVAAAARDFAIRHHGSSAIEAAVAAALRLDFRS